MSELFDRYGARYIQLQLAVAQAVSDHADEIVAKVVQRIMEEDRDPILVEYVNEMTVDFLTDLYSYLVETNGALPAPQITYVDQPQPEPEPEPTWWQKCAGWIKRIR